VRDSYIGPKKIIKPIYGEYISGNRLVKGEAGSCLVFIYSINKYD